MSCSDPDCGACLIREVMQSMKDRGAPVDVAVEFMLSILGEVYTDTDFEHAYIAPQGDPGVVH